MSNHLTLFSVELMNANILCMAGHVLILQGMHQSIKTMDRRWLITLFFIGNFLIGIQAWWHAMMSTTSQGYMTGLMPMRILTIVMVVVYAGFAALSGWKSIRDKDSSFAILIAACLFMTASSAVLSILML